MEYRTETIYEILNTRTEDLRPDQVHFMEQVMDIYGESRRKPWCVLASVLGFAVSFGGTLSLLALPLTLPIWLAYIGGAAASIGCAHAMKKSLSLANYEKIGTNKFSFEDFEMYGGVKQVQEKLENFYEYEAEQLMQEFMDFGKPEVKNSTQTNTKKEENTLSNDNDLMK